MSGHTDFWRNDWFTQTNQPAPGNKTFGADRVETRRANWLLKRCANPGSNQPVKIILSMTKRVLAAELGTVSETFSRTLAKFREPGLLEVNGKTLTLLCPAKLAALLRKNPGE